MVVEITGRIMARQTTGVVQRLLVKAGMAYSSLDESVVSAGTYSESILRDVEENYLREFVWCRLREAYSESCGDEH